MKLYQKHWLLITGFMLGTLLIGIGLINLKLVQGVSSAEFNNANQVRHMKVAIIFGALVRPDHSLSPILRDRVNGGIELYTSRRAEKLLMSGDNSSSHYDEVTAMKDYAVAHGVPASDIVLDYAGLNTYDTCYRARNIFGLTEAILVTQKYHMPRALYTCHGLGIRVIGYGLTDFSKYPDLEIPYLLRESIANIKATWEINVSHRRAKILGRPVSI